MAKGHQHLSLHCASLGGIIRKQCRVSKRLICAAHHHQHEAEQEEFGELLLKGRSLIHKSVLMQRAVEECTFGHLALKKKRKKKKGT